MTIKYRQMLGEASYVATERNHECVVWREGGKWYTNLSPGEAFDTRSAAAVAGLAADARAKTAPPQDQAAPATIQLYDVYATDTSRFVMRAPLQTIRSVYNLHTHALSRIRVEAAYEGCKLHSCQLMVHVATGPLAGSIPTNPEEM